MKKLLTWFLVLTVLVALAVSTCVSAFEGSGDTAPSTVIQPTVADAGAAPQSSECKRDDSAAKGSAASKPESFPSVQAEIVYKMLNSMDYFSTAKVRFSAVFPGFDTAQQYAIETNLDTGIAHQICSDFSVAAPEAAQAYETYSDGSVVWAYNNLKRTVSAVGAVQERRTLEEDWPDGKDRHYIDENGQPHYRYRSNATNADMAGECLLPQVSAFAYLMDTDLWEVVDTVMYCDRSCYHLAGVVNKGYAEKTGAQTFRMYVDQETGILLMLEACDGAGNIVSSVEVTDITLDDPSICCTFDYDLRPYDDYQTAGAQGN